MKGPGGGQRGTELPPPQPWARGQGALEQHRGGQSIAEGTMSALGGGPAWTHWGGGHAQPESTQAL